MDFLQKIKLPVCFLYRLAVLVFQAFCPVVRFVCFMLLQWCLTCEVKACRMTRRQIFMVDKPCSTLLFKFVCCQPMLRRQRCGPACSLVWQHHWQHLPVTVYQHHLALRRLQHLVLCWSLPEAYLKHSFKQRLKAVTSLYYVIRWCNATSKKWYSLRYCYVVGVSDVAS